MRSIAIAVCFLLCACQKAAPAPDDAAVDKRVRTEVTAMLEAWAKARTDGDWDGVGKLYAEDDGFAWIEQGQVRFATSAAAIAGLEGAKAAASKQPTKVSEILVTPLSDEAAAFRVRVKVDANYGSDAPPVATDEILSGVAFEYDHVWKILQGHIETRGAAPPPAPPADENAQDVAHP